MRTLSLVVLLLSGCDRHTRSAAAAASAKPAPVAVAPSAAPRAPAAEDAATMAHVAEVLGAAHGLADVRVASTRIWTTKADGSVVAWALSATHAATGRAVGVAGASVGDRIYVDAATIRAQVGESTAKVRARPALPAAPERIVAAGSPVERGNLAVVVAMRAALVARNEADFLRFLADDVEHDDATEPETSRGKEEARRFFARLPKDATFELHDTWTAGDWVIAESTQSGTKVLSVWRFADGLVRAGATYPDYRSSIAAPARGGPNQ